MNKSIEKNDSLYVVFKDLIVLKIESLKIDNKLHGLLEQEYEFYKVEDIGINNNRKLFNDESKYLSIGCWMNGSYIIAVNKTTGISYRLKGFDINDFMGFLSDFKEVYNKNNVNKLKLTSFLKNYKVQDLDFECLYKGLKSKEINREKYICLKRCSEDFIIKN